MKHEVNYLLVGIILSFSHNAVSQNFSSPCPRLFNYETKTIERDKYFGNVRIETMDHLHGVWLKLFFDKPCMQIGNWLGEVSTEDNREFTIKKQKLYLKPGDFLTVRFYVKFMPNRPIPQIMSIKLNGKTVCPESVQVLPTTFPSVSLETTHSNTYDIVLEERNGNGSSESTQAPTTSTTAITPPSPYNLIEEIEVPAPTPHYGIAQETEDYGEFFQGDLSLVSLRPKSEQCGIVIPPPNSRYEHGEHVNEGSFPWHAAIYLSKGTELNYICASSLISSKFVITAAHCVTKRNSEKVVRSEHLLVYLGKCYLRRWSNPGIQERQVKDIFIHEKYNHITTDNDVALLKLIKPVKVTNFVRPVCLWTGDSKLENIIGESGMVAGWGFNERGIVTSKLVRTYMPIVSKDTCINSYPEFFSHFISTKSYCAGFSNETKICSGDSGGGMVLSRREPGLSKPVYYLRGVISISVALQNVFKCDNEHYAIFIDVAKYLTWIDKFDIN